MINITCNISNGSPVVSGHNFLTNTAPGDMLLHEHSTAYFIESIATNGDAVLDRPFMGISQQGALLNLVQLSVTPAALADKLSETHQAYIGLYQQLGRYITDGGSIDFNIGGETYTHKTLPQLNLELEQQREQTRLAVDDSVHRKLRQSLYLDTTNGHDSHPGSPSLPFKSLKALLDAVPSGAVVTILGPAGQTLAIDTPIILLNKRVAWRIPGCTWRMLRGIELHGGLLRTSYPITIEQLTAHAFLHYGTEFRLAVNVTPSAEAKSLLHTIYNGGHVSQPAGVHSPVYISGSVSDAENDYALCSVHVAGSTMLVNLRSMILGANCSLFAAPYQTLQVGNRQTYLIGA